MAKFTLNQIIVFSVAFWGVFTWLSLLIGHDHLFHYIIPAFISLLFVIILVYGRGLFDIWVNRKNLTSSHLLILGIVLSAIGVATRLLRWYITNAAVVTHSNTEFWVFNIGIGFGIWGGLFLGAAANIAVKTFNPGTLVVIFLAIFSVLLYLDFANLRLLNFY